MGQNLHENMEGFRRAIHIIIIIVLHSQTAFFLFIFPPQYKKCNFTLDKTMFRTLYVGLVRPHLEYASEIWNPYLIGDIQTLEKVQRRATKLVPELRHLDYTSRLVALNLPSLLFICRRMDMITVFRIVHGLQGVPFGNLFLFHNTITRGNGYKLY